MCFIQNSHCILCVPHVFRHVSVPKHFYPLPNLTSHGIYLDIPDSQLPPWNGCHASSGGGCPVSGSLPNCFHQYAGARYQYRTGFSVLWSYSLSSPGYCMYYDPGSYQYHLCQATVQAASVRYIIFYLRNRKQLRNRPSAKTHVILYL